MGEFVMKRRRRPRAQAKLEAVRRLKLPESRAKAQARNLQIGSRCDSAIVLSVAREPKPPGRAAATFREEAPRPAPVRSEWSEVAIAILRARWAEGFSASQIAAIIEREAGQRCTRNAVIGKMHRLGLAGRASHVRSAKVIKNRLANVRLRLNETPPNLGSRRRNRAAFKARRFTPAAALPPAPNADGEPVIVLNVRDGECRFIAGDPRDGAPFCGRATEARGHGAHAPFCAAHAKICYLPNFFGAVRP